MGHRTTGLSDFWGTAFQPNYSAAFSCLSLLPLPSRSIRATCSPKHREMRYASCRREALTCAVDGSSAPPPPTDRSVSVDKDDVLAVEARTVAWVRIVVVGLGLCPFAQAAFDRARVRIVVSQAREEVEMQADVMREVGILVGCGREDVETTLVVAPWFAQREFLRFHRFGATLEECIEEDDSLADTVMVARFHPEHMWANCATEDPLNYDKRAPYPIVNLLRAEQVDEYIEQGRTEGILERNRETLSSMGSKKLLDLYNSLSDA